MAAQERAKQAQQPTPAAKDPPPAFDDLILKNEEEDSKPPAFDASMVPPPQETAPPAFDDSLLPPSASDTATTTNAAAMFDPLAAPPAPSAPSFEDLGDLLSQPTGVVGTNEPTPMMPPPFEAPPSTSENDSNDAIEAILGMEGLSEEEKRALIAEQEKIMASIEASKSNAAASAADAFEQRSTAAAIQAVSGGTGSSTTRSLQLQNGEQVQLHGQEQTRQAIADGTAALVQCLSCENWMQVTQAATLMFCPVCQTVSPVLIADESTDVAASAQLQSDLELAQQLQKEEYQAAERAEQRQKQKKEQAKAASASGSWMEWFGFSSGAAESPERPTSFAQAPVGRGQQGVSRPPGSGAASPGRLTSANTESIQFTSSADEEDALLSGGSPGGARMAESKPLFSCVADSITSAASNLMTLPSDAEGNVHGVDSSSLLAVPMVGRQNSTSSNGNAPNSGV